MKLIYLADTANIHTQKWVRYFLQLGVEISCISFSDFEIKGTKHFLINKKIVGQINPTLNLLKKVSYLKNLNRVKEIIHSQKPDILHAHYASSYGLIGSLCNYHPFIISVWGSDVMLFPKKSIFTRQILKNNLRKADVICSTSEAMVEELKIYTNKKILLTPFGVDTKKFKPLTNGKKTETIVIGTVKSLEKVYGIDTLIKAFKIVLKQFPNLILKIVGTGTQEKVFKDLVKELGLNEKIEFLGRIPNEEVPKTLNSFDIFIALSRSESFGVSVVEASACGIPVIVSDVGGLPEVVINEFTGLIVQKDSVKEASEAMIKLISNEKLREEMSKNGRNFVAEKYNWSENSKIMLNLYESILSKK